MNGQVFDFKRVLENNIGIKTYANECEYLYINIYIYIKNLAVKTFIISNKIKDVSF